MGAETGLLLVDKPAGMTSHGAVAAVRRRLGIRRIGHTGTLDPFATGLLLLLVGRFTRAAEYFHVLPKTYGAEMRLGVETDTHDPSGTPRGERDVSGLDEAAVESALGDLRGESLQRPPAFSAKKVGGRRAHHDARAGSPPRLDPVPITVHRVEMESFAPPLVGFSVTVSTGTYVRALARDVGRALGCGAHLTRLRRTGIGPFRVEAALAPDDPGLAAGAPGVWLDPGEALSWMPRRDLTGDESESLSQGRALPMGAAPGSETREGPIAAYHDGELVAIAMIQGERLRPKKVFA